MATIDKIKAFAKKNGYAEVEFHGTWNGYDVYQPHIFADKAPVKVGPPLKILVKGRKIRLTTVDEAFAYLDTLPPGYDEEEV